MTYLLDTNLICEATSKRPDARVMAWTAAHGDESCLSCLSLGEIWKGIHRLPDGKRKRSISEWAVGIESDFSTRVLILDAGIMKVWGKLYADNVARGFNMGIPDSLLAATALAHQLTIATRNKEDFPREVKTVNPWE